MASEPICAKASDAALGRSSSAEASKATRGSMASGASEPSRPKAAAVDKGSELGFYSRYTQRALDKLQQYRPAEYPREDLGFKLSVVADTTGRSPLLVATWDEILAKPKLLKEQPLRTQRVGGGPEEVAPHKPAPKEETPEAPAEKPKEPEKAKAPKDEMPGDPVDDVMGDEPDDDFD